MDLILALPAQYQETAKVILHILDVMADLIFALSIAATIVARLFKSKASEEFIGGAESKIIKLLSYLPTYGKNPRTKQLEAAYAELKAEVVESAPVLPKGQP